MKTLNIVKYKKLENMVLDQALELDPGLNIISGTNGTCKTSLLHIVSNAYQSVTKTDDRLVNPSCLDDIRRVNSMINPKIESLTKGDKAYNDPSNGLKGTLFTVEYFDHPSLGFRKHNSKASHRYAVKPHYSRGTNEKLPSCLVLYLGLTRLYPFGEYPNSGIIRKLKNNLPLQYQEEISTLYKGLTGINITAINPEKIGEIKTRADFETDKTGIDSNTISSGEENLFIILTALVSLKYYFENIVSRNRVESVLLIDEFDATLHPFAQLKLLDIIRQYSSAYKIQTFLTTHSLSTIEYAFEKKDNVIYLIDDVNKVIKMANPDIYKIKMYLHQLTKADLYRDKVIPVFTEDNEARRILTGLLDYFAERDPGFAGVHQFFYFVDTNIGAQNLQLMFRDPHFLNVTKFICILDGDQKEDIKNHMIVLPGGDSPERVIMDYSLKLYESDAPLWQLEEALDNNYSKIRFRDKIKPDILNIGIQLDEAAATCESGRGKRRGLTEKVFDAHRDFFEFLIPHWIRDVENARHIEHFYKQLNIMFKKTATSFGISPSLWTVD